MSFVFTLDPTTKSLIPNRKVLFPPSLWNQMDEASSGLARTTNAVEGWFYGIQSYFSGLHPSKWKVIANLQKDASNKKLFYIASSGHQFTKKQKVPGAQRKSAKYYACLRKKTDLHFFRAMANLSLRFVLQIYLQLKTLFGNFFEKRRFLPASGRRKKTH